MKEIGNILREKRNENNYSEEYVNAQTHIPKKYIVAIEEGDLSVFPAEVYYLGSMKRYARFLGLNDEDLVDIYRKKVVETSLIKQPLTNRPDEVLSRPFKIILFLILPVLLICAFLWAERGMIMPIFKTIVKPAVVVTKPLAISKKTETVTKQQPVSSDFTLKIKCIERTWVKVVTDENMAFEGLLDPGKEEEWTANDKFYISIGYVPGVIVSINGKPVDVSEGAKGDVNSLTFTKNDLKKTGE